MNDFLVLDKDIAINIGDIDKNWDSSDQNWFFIDSGVWYITKGTIWDGATLAPDGKEDPNKPGYPILWLPTLIHDLGYYGLEECEDFPYSRKQIDKIFKKLMDDVDWSLSSLYYRAVRWFGGAFSNLISLYRKAFNKQRTLPSHLCEYEEFYPLYEDCYELNCFSKSE